MAEVNNITAKIQQYLDNHPEKRNLSEEQILVFMQNSNELTAAEVEEAKRTSAFSNVQRTQNTAMTGLEVEKSDNTPPAVTNFDGDNQQISLEEQQAQETVIRNMSENVQQALDIVSRQNNGKVISQGYDTLKEFFNSELSEKNVEEVIDGELDTIDYLSAASKGNLYKAKYYSENRDRLKQMMIARLTTKDTKSGIDILDSLKGKYSKNEFKRIIEKYIDEMVNNLSGFSTKENPNGAIKAIKDLQHKLVTQEFSVQKEMFKNIAKKAVEKASSHFSMEGKGMSNKASNKSIPPAYANDEKMNFDEVFQLETGVPYHKDNIENFTQKKAEMAFVTGAYNKYKQFETASDKILNNGGSSEKLADEVSDLFQKYYSNSPNDNAAIDSLKSLIRTSNLPIEVTKGENGKIDFNLKAYGDENSKANALKNLVRLGKQEQKVTLDKIMEGKDIEYYAKNYENAYQAAYGNENAEELAKAMEKDNMEAIKKYSNVATYTGLGLAVVGKVVTFTPLAPVGVTMLGLGEGAMATGIIAKNALSFAEASTRPKINREEINNLSKELAFDVMTFGVGCQAAKVGTKLGAKVLQSGGSKFQSLFVEKGADFTISLAGDVAMTSAMQAGGSIETLTVSNIVGITASTLLGIKTGKKSARKAGQNVDSFLKGENFAKNSPQITKGTMQKGTDYVANLDRLPALDVGGEVVDLNTPEYSKLLFSLKDKEYLVIGREGHILTNPNNNIVSRKHVLVYKEGGQIRIRDISTNGTKVVTDASISTTNIPPKGKMAQYQNYQLDINKLPKLKLAGKEEIDLGKYKNEISNLKEGDMLTIGRDGDIKTSDNDEISRQHIVIYVSNGQLKIKDISANGTEILENGIMNKIKNKISDVMDSFNN